MKLERLLTIIFKLLHRSTISASQLAEELNVSQRTIYRDIETISPAGIPITSYHGTNGGFGIIENYKWDKTFLDASSMLEVLSLVKNLSNQLNDHDLKKTVDRLSILTSEEQKNHLHIDLTHFSVDPSFLINLQKSIKELTRICFQYISSQNEQTTREVDPLSL
ncbi:HTH domain-containing protein [Exiguobacterium sp. FSL W8-0210]|uniref:helix-turn-helix transcriptional regulator n=1 Tax=Exiguobacterium sp. FSL W8-0210 TaxID=2921598 RepID=UPI0030F8FA50